MFPYSGGYYHTSVIMSYLGRRIPLFLLISPSPRVVGDRGLGSIENDSVINGFVIDEVLVVLQSHRP